MSLQEELADAREKWAQLAPTLEEQEPAEEPFSGLASSGEGNHLGLDSGPVLPTNEPLEMGFESGEVVGPSGGLEPQIRALVAENQYLRELLAESVETARVAVAISQQSTPEADLLAELSALTQELHDTQVRDEVKAFRLEVAALRKQLRPRRRWRFWR